VLQTLGLMDGVFNEVGRGVAERRYALWLGSGISRERVDDLRTAIERALNYLHDRIDFADRSCRFRKALEEAVTISQLSDLEKRTFNIEDAIGTWPVLPAVLERLARAYSKFLDVRVEGEKPDFILWQAIDVVRTYGDATAVPDCEHFCVAILVTEGLVGEIASANWDGLVEKALAELTNNASDILRVCVKPEDFREPPLRGRLLKFHGCAIRAAADEGTYRPLLVASESQIVTWPEDPGWAVMRNELESLATTAPTIMIGLSAQDSNIKSVFVRAQSAPGRGPHIRLPMSLLKTRLAQTNAHYFVAFIHGHTKHTRSI
jgi:hypothetical protein